MSLAIGSIGRRGTSLLLDALPAAAVAYSTRKLRTAYAGACLQVRRESDDAEDDFGFALDGWLDVAALATFCAGTTGRIATWYDQSGNGRNATQNDPTKQPRIYAGGAVDTKNGHPALLAAGDRLTVASSFAHGGSAFTTTAITAATALSFGRVVSIRSTGDANDYSTTNSVAAILTASATWEMQSFRAAAYVPVTIVNGQLHAVHTRYAAGDVVATAVDGSESTGAFTTSGLGADVVFSMLADDLDAGPFAGSLGEVVHWLSSLSSPDRTTLYANQAAAWGL
jgi:hypothetical protein